MPVSITLSVAIFSWCIMPNTTESGGLCAVGHRSVLILAGSVLWPVCSVSVTWRVFRHILTPVPISSPTTVPIPFPTPIIGPSTFTGTFRADARPYDIDFLNLTQSGLEVSGYVTIITQDGYC
jgi:hypothetical protein